MDLSSERLIVTSIPGLFLQRQSWAPTLACRTSEDSPFLYRTGSTRFEGVSGKTAGSWFIDDPVRCCRNVLKFDTCDASESLNVFYTARDMPSRMGGLPVCFYTLFYDDSNLGGNFVKGNACTKTSQNLRRCA